jgi:protein-tyrosine phosphatase
MIDIHCHVLPGLDDGSRSLEESLAMLRAAAEAGTTDLVATPHANLEFRYDPAQVDQALAELRQAGGGLVRLHRGCDFHLYYDNIHDALSNPSKYSINGKGYLLVEFPDLLVAKGTTDIFARLKTSGLTPIVTHPERNYLLHSRLKDLAGWVAEGALVQVTGQSLLGRFGPEARRVARELIGRGLVHFVASDAHDAEDRTPRLDEAYREVAGRFGEPYAEQVFRTNPRAVIEGQPLGPQCEPAAGRKWWKWWGG